MTNPLTGRAYVAIRTDDGRGLAVNRGGNVGESVPAWVQTDATVFFLVHADSGTNVGPVLSGGRVRLRGIDRDPWLRFDASSPFVFGVRGNDMYAGTPFVLQADGGSDGAPITDAVRFFFCLDEPRRPLKVDAGRLTVSTSSAEAVRFQFEPGVIPPDQVDRPVYCVKLFFYDRPPLAFTVEGSRDEAFDAMYRARARYPESSIASSRVDQGAC